MLKKIVIFSLLLTACIASVFSQQQMLTRIAVVDMSKVYTEVNQQSQAVRDFQAQSARVQAELERMQNDLRTLDSRRADAILRNDQNAVTSLTREITTKTEELRVYHQARTAELDAVRRNINSTTFMQSIQNELRSLAESEGITTILDLSQIPGIIWFSPAVDYTDRLIARLRTRFN